MVTSTKTKIEYEVLLSADAVDDDRYVVGAVDERGHMYMATFSGQNAKGRAEEYARFKNGQES